MGTCLTDDLVSHNVAVVSFMALGKEFKCSCERRTDCCRTRLERWSGRYFGDVPTEDIDTLRLYNIFTFRFM